MKNISDLYNNVGDYASYDLDSFLKNFHSAFSCKEQKNHGAFPGKPFFEGNDEKQKHVCLGANYLDVAYNLLQQLDDKNVDQKADKWILPIIFLICNGIELYLKPICRVLESLVFKETKKFAKDSHFLLKICIKIKDMSSVLGVILSTPHMWGCTAITLLPVCPPYIYPTYVGMYRAWGLAGGGQKHLPHIRGDVPW